MKPIFIWLCTFTIDDKTKRNVIYHVTFVATTNDMSSTLGIWHYHYHRQAVFGNVIAYAEMQTVFIELGTFFLHTYVHT